MTAMHNFIRSLPNCAELDPVKRTAAEREIEQRVGALSTADRATFETTLREINAEAYRGMNFEQRWLHAREHAALKEQIEGTEKSR